MSDHLDIEKLFKDKLTEVEHSVSPDLWNNISSSISTSAASSSASSSFLGLTKLGTIITVASAVGIISAGAVYLSMNNELKKLKTQAENLEPVQKEKDNSNTKENIVKKAKVETTVIETKNDNATSETFVVVQEPKTTINSKNSEIITVEHDAKDDPAINAIVYNDDTTSTYIVSLNETEVSENHEPEDDKVINVIKPVENSKPNYVELNASTISGFAPLDVIFSSGGNGVEEFWEFGDGNTSVGIVPKHSFNEPGSYTVKLTTTFKDGQKKTVSKVIEVKKGSEITKVPNVFSPNGDYINDEYFIEMDGIIDFRGMIYDLEGNTVFEFIDAEQRWDGRNKYGEDLPIGKYILTYTAEGIDGKIYKNKVFITLTK